MWLQQQEQLCVFLLLAASVLPFRYHNKVLSCWHGVKHLCVDVDSTLRVTLLPVRTSAGSEYDMSCHVM